MLFTGRVRTGIAETSIRTSFRFQNRLLHQDKTFRNKVSLQDAFTKWRNSLRTNRLKEIQDELLELMISKKLQENSGIIRTNKRTIIDEEGNQINELNLKIVNDAMLQTKHIVFIHGYGASLGCFARNFQIINNFKNLKDSNYEIHFLDNLTFGLSSNPKIKSDKVNSWFIDKCPTIKLDDPDKSIDKSKLYNKYYKLVKGFEIDPKRFIDYQEHYRPILKEIETFYVSAIENWRKASNIQQIDCLIGHSFGGYWSGSYSLKHPDKLKHLILLSPVGVERHVHAVTSDLVEKNEGQNYFKPELSPISYKFLTRIPLLSKKQELTWYYVLPFWPRFLKLLGPWGYRSYFNLWYSKLFKINKVIENIGGEEKVINSENDKVYGTNRECHLIIEYLYNSITRGSQSDIYIKNVLTPSTVSKWPLYDKFHEFYNNTSQKQKFSVDLFYGEFDFMNAEAGQELVKLIKSNVQNPDTVSVKFHSIAQGGHNLYIDNPFDTNQAIFDIIKSKN